MHFDIHNAIETATNHHRTILFWSWNGELEPEELKEQIRQMKEAGIGGYFIRVRGGGEAGYKTRCRRWEKKSPHRGKPGAGRGGKKYLLLLFLWWYC